LTALLRKLSIKQFAVLTLNRLNREIGTYKQMRR